MRGNKVATKVDPLPSPARATSRQSRIDLLLIWVLFGWLGVHRFAAGRILTGLLFTLVIILFPFWWLTLYLAGTRIFALPPDQLKILAICPLGILIFWWFVDGILILFGGMRGFDNLKMRNWQTSFENPSPANRLTALILCFALGLFGAHRWYLRRPFSAFLMLITFGGIGIWYLIDHIWLLAGGFLDSRGRPVSHWFRRGMLISLPISLMIIVFLAIGTYRSTDQVLQFLASKTPSILRQTHYIADLEQTLSEHLLVLHNKYLKGVATLQDRAAAYTSPSNKLHETR